MEGVRVSVLLFLVTSSAVSALPMFDYGPNDWYQHVDDSRYNDEYLPAVYGQLVYDTDLNDEADPNTLRGLYLQEVYLEPLREKRSTVQWPNVSPSSSSSFSSSSGNSFSSNIGGALVSNSNTNTETGASSTGGGVATGAATSNAGGAATDHTGAAVTSNSNGNGVATAESLPNFYGLFNPGISTSFANTQGNSFGSNINGALVSNGNTNTNSGATSTGGGSASGVGSAIGNNGAFNTFNPLSGSVYSTTNSNSAANAQSQPSFTYPFPNCNGPQCPLHQTIKKDIFDPNNSFGTIGFHRPNRPINSLPCQPFPQCLNLTPSHLRRRRSTCQGQNCPTVSGPSSTSTSSSSGTSFSSNIGGALVSNSNTETANIVSSTNGGTAMGISNVNAAGSAADLLLGSAVSGSTGNSALVAASHYNIYNPFNQAVNSGSASTVGNSFGGNFAGALVSSGNSNSQSGASSSGGGSVSGFGLGAVSGGATGAQSQIVTSNTNSNSAVSSASLANYPFTIFSCTPPHCPVPLVKLHRTRRSSRAAFGYPGISSSQSFSSGSSTNTNFGGTGVSNSNTQTYNRASSSGGGTAVASSNSNAAGSSNNLFTGSSSSGSNSNSIASAVSNQNVFPILQGGFIRPVQSLPCYGPKCYRNY